MPDGANPETNLRGSVLVLLQFDVAEAIRLDRLQELIRARTVQRPSLKHPAPGYVRYQRPPVVEALRQSLAHIMKTNWMVALSLAVRIGFPWESVAL